MPASAGGALPIDYRCTDGTMFANADALPIDGWTAAAPGRLPGGSNERDCWLRIDLSVLGHARD